MPELNTDQTTPELYVLRTGEVVEVSSLTGEPGVWVAIWWGSHQDYLDDTREGHGERATCSVADHGQDWLEAELGPGARRMTDAGEGDRG